MLYLVPLGFQKLSLYHNRSSVDWIYEPYLHVCAFGVIRVRRPDLHQRLSVDHKCSSGS